MVETEYSIWCPKCDKDRPKEGRQPRIEINGYYHCGTCKTRIVNIADENCCVACGKNAYGKWTCENCYQWICGRHTEKRTVHGFAIWGCPTCHAISEPRKDYMKDEIKGSYTGFRFVWNKELGWYEWDGDLSLCYFETTVLPMRREFLEHSKTELDRFKRYNMLLNTHTFLKDFIDVEKAEKWLQKYEENLK